MVPVDRPQDPNHGSVDWTGRPILFKAAAEILRRLFPYSLTRAFAIIMAVGQPCISGSQHRWFPTSAAGARETHGSRLKPRECA